MTLGRESPVLQSKAIRQAGSRQFCKAKPLGQEAPALQSKTLPTFQAITCRRDLFLGLTPGPSAPKQRKENGIVMI